MKWWLLCCLIGMSASVIARDGALNVITDATKVVSGGISRDGVLRTLVIAEWLQPVSEQWEFLLQGQLQRGKDGSEATGDIQAFSNIDEGDFTRLYEAWLQGQLTDQLRIKIGKVDANTEFAYAELGGEFIHASMGFSPTIAFFPTYPLPTLSINGFYQFSDSWQLSAAVYSDDNQKFAHPFWISEVVFQTQWQRWVLGYWHQQGAQQLLHQQGQKNGANGLYVIAEYPLAEQLGVFAQLGKGPSQVSEFQRYYGAGLVFQQVFDRPDDLIGLGISRVKVGLPEQPVDYETAVELHYRYQLNSYLALKPVFHYIHQPGADAQIADAYVLTLRIDVSL